MPVPCKVWCYNSVVELEIIYYDTFCILILLRILLCFHMNLMVILFLSRRSLTISQDFHWFLHANFDNTSFWLCQFCQFMDILNILKYSFFFNFLNFSLWRSFTSPISFAPVYFSQAILGYLLYIPYPFFSMLTINIKESIDFSIFLKLFISSNGFLMKYLGLRNIISSVNKDTLTSTFPIDTFLMYCLLR